ncbi:MAG: tyrosine-type recombinase/integrase [Armatimonadota bacterium]
MNDSLDIYVNHIPETAGDITEYLDASISDNTRRAYRTLWRQFDSWCDYQRFEALPASPETVVSYLIYIAKEGRKASTVNSTRAAIRLAHQSAGFPDPTDTPIVKQTLKGIRRKHGTAPVQKSAVLPPDIRAMVDTLDTTTLIGKRDRAIILLGFFTASRRSELKALTTDDIHETVEGLEIIIRKSKTDQEGQGFRKAVTRQDNPPFCPVRALSDYLQSAGIASGPVFRSIGKGGKVSKSALTGHSIACIVKDTAAKAGLNPDKYSGHSLRAGLVTTAAKEGASMIEIMAQTGHRSTDTVAKYIRKARLFEDTVTKRIKL